MGRVIFTSSSQSPHFFGDRLPENYILICPERSQVQQLSDTQCSLHDFFHPKVGNHAWFWNSFATPIQNAQRIQKFRPRNRPSKQLSPLERLPGELIEELIEKLLEEICGKAWTVPQIVSVLALGLSSPVLYPRVLSRIHREHERQTPKSWAGTRVGFHSNFSYLTNEQEKRYGGFLGSADTLGKRWWSWPRANAEPEMFWHETIASVRQDWGEIDERGWQDISADVSQGYMYPQDRTWVLRNLDTRQIVRSDSLVPPSSITQGKLPSDHLNKLNLSMIKRLWSTIISAKQPAQAPLTLAQIFFILTAYTVSTNGLETDYLFKTGPWTAHAFDVVTLDQHMASGEAGWSDVSALAVADVGHLRWCVQQCVLMHKAQWTRKVNALLLYGCISEQREKWHSWTRPRDDNGHWEGT